MFGATRIPAPVGLVVVAALALVATPRPTAPEMAPQPVVVVQPEPEGMAIAPAVIDTAMVIQQPETGDRMNQWRPPLWDLFEPLLESCCAKRNRLL